MSIRQTPARPTCGGDGSRSALGTSAPMPQLGCPVIRAPCWLSRGVVTAPLLCGGHQPFWLRPSWFTVAPDPGGPFGEIPGRGGWCTWRASADFRPRPAATGIGSCTAPAVTWTAAWSSIPHERGPARDPWHAGRVLGVRARRRRPRRLCTLVQARSDSLLRAPGPTRHTPVGPGYVPHAGDAPASAPGPRAREPARRSGNVFMSPAPDRRANRRPERGGFRP
jgi:hypothetical protein